MHTGQRLLIEDLSAELLDPAAGPGVLPGGGLALQGTVRQVVVHADPDPEATPYTLLAGATGRGWPHVGRHFLVPRAPEVREGRLVVQQLLSPEWVGLGVPPNFGRVHVVCAGLCPSGPQREALGYLLQHLQDTHNLRAAALTPHREIEPRTRCPGDVLAGYLHFLHDTRRPFGLRTAPR